ncbi:MAG: DUF2950 family protein [Planctomycetota bacterium]
MTYSNKRMCYSVTSRLVIVLAAAITISACNTAPTVTAAAQFSTPDAAVAALKGVLQNPNPRVAEALFGPRWSELRQDPDEAPRMRAAFLTRLERGYRIDRVGDGAILVVGTADDPDRFAFAVPLRERDGRWSWDTAAGIEEFRLRRLGRNELDTIDAMKAIAAAQRAYFDGVPQGGTAGAFAARIKSSDGRKDGLYWPTTGVEAPSPLGAAIAGADCTGGAPKNAVAFNGYWFAVMPASASGSLGTVIAWPEQYGVSGIMTFMVGSDGIVYERDLGDDTPRAREKCSDPASGGTSSAGWTRSDTPPTK